MASSSMTSSCRDRLTALPESLTTAILSLLPLKDAVRTSVLARSWRYTWRSRANIEIDDSDFPSLNRCLYFTRRWLLNYPLASVSSLSLRMTLPLPESVSDHIDRLIAWFVWSTLRRGAQSLDLDFSGPVPFEIPEFVYTYEWLDHLRLLSCNFKVTSFKNLSWLKTASFGRMSLENDQLRALLRGCPLLESLSLVECEDGDEYVVVSPKMKSLTIEGCVDLTRLVVSTPELNRFKYAGVLCEFDIINVGRVEEVDIELGFTSFYDDETGESVQSLLVPFHCARVLRVCTWTTQVLATASSEWRLSRELAVKHLIFKSAFHHYEFIGIACLIRSCPTLSKIQFDIGPQRIFEDDEFHPCADLEIDTFWGEQFKAPRCVKSTLKEVEINGFRGTDNEVRFLKFLFDFGSELTTVRVRVARDDAGAWMQMVLDYSRILRAWHEVSIHTLNIFVE